MSTDYTPATGDHVRVVRTWRDPGVRGGTDSVSMTGTVTRVHADRMEFDPDPGGDTWLVTDPAQLAKCGITQTITRATAP